MCSECKDNKIKEYCEDCRKRHQNARSAAYYKKKTTIDTVNKVIIATDSVQSNQHNLALQNSNDNCSNSGIGRTSVNNGLGGINNSNSGFGDKKRRYINLYIIKNKKNINIFIRINFYMLNKKNSQYTI